jgi:hypothetical protein
MRTLLGATVVLLMLVPRPAVAQTGITDVRTLCHPLDIQKNKPEEAPCLQQLHAMAERNDDVLTLKLDNGKTKVFKNNTKACEQGSDGCVEYRLVGYIESDRQFVVEVLYYESGLVNLVSRRNGMVTRLEDWPHLSPNNKRFVVVAASDAWGIDNAIAIFSATSDLPRLEWNFPTPKEYEQYTFDGWDGDNRVRLRVFADGNETETDLKRTPQGWQLKRPSPPVSPAAIPSPAPLATPLGQPTKPWPEPAR